MDERKKKRKKGMNNESSGIDEKNVTKYREGLNSIKLNCSSSHLGNINKKYIKRKRKNLDTRTCCCKRTS